VRVYCAFESHTSHFKHRNGVTILFGDLHGGSSHFKGLGARGSTDKSLLAMVLLCSALCVPAGQILFARDGCSVHHGCSFLRRRVDWSLLLLGDQVHRRAKGTCEGFASDGRLLDASSSGFGDPHRHDSVHLHSPEPNGAGDGVDGVASQWRKRSKDDGALRCRCRLRDRW